MGKESKSLFQPSNAQNIPINNHSNINKQIIYIPGKLINEKAQYIAKNFALYEKANNLKNYQSYENNTLKKEEQRKNSVGSETSCDSKKTSPKKRIIINPLPKESKNKIPFKGEAKDFKIKYKTELCKYFEINGYCKYGDKCAYAHGKENLRSKVTNTVDYRTKKCSKFFEQGYCPYGNRCQFAHQLKSNIINNPYDRGMTYGKILETLSKMENVENIKKLIGKPRLPVFQKICENKENTQSRLLDDIKSLNKSYLYRRKSN